MIEVKTTCIVCGGVVETELRSLRDGLVTLEVEPCPTCIKAAKAEGYDGIANPDLKGR